MSHEEQRIEGSAPRGVERLHLLRSEHSRHHHRTWIGGWRNRLVVILEPELHGLDFVGLGDRDLLAEQQDSLARAVGGRPRGHGQRLRMVTNHSLHERHIRRRVIGTRGNARSRHPGHAHGRVALLSGARAAQPAEDKHQPGLSEDNPAERTFHPVATPVGPEDGPMFGIRDNSAPGTRPELAGRIGGRVGLHRSRRPANSRPSRPW